ncbi:hypothetical protein L2E82_42245 [Cichorium intybus]|uniref:Uncharacterized protein n=1 Tax=Cichorium intybus TaxID=13427 RepID=A0ACB8ZR38_CICIN|nr:hypothetical protein L2E82_42245 [Cichorium intybus]
MVRSKLLDKSISTSSESLPEGGSSSQNGGVPQKSNLAMTKTKGYSLTFVLYGIVNHMTESGPPAVTAGHRPPGFIRKRRRRRCPSPLLSMPTTAAEQHSSYIAGEHNPNPDKIRDAICKMIGGEIEGSRMLSRLYWIQNESNEDAPNDMQKGLRFGEESQSDQIPNSDWNDQTLGVHSRRSHSIPPALQSSKRSNCS